MPERFLLVQLADIGDLIVTTPAIAALREAHPGAHLTLLTSDHSAPVIEGTGLVDDIITFDRRNFNNSTSLFRPANLRRILSLRQGHYDTVIFFHHFTLRLGTLKFALIAWSSGAKQRVGLDNGHGWFLTHRAPDDGFGAKHQAQYWLDLVGLAGADSSPRAAIININSQLDIGRGGSETRPYGNDAPRIIIHTGSGGYSLARRWDAVSFAQVADQLHEELGAQIVLVGTPGDDGARVKAAMQHEPLDMIGKTSLAQLAGVIQPADLFIGADSGVMHVAAAVGTPVLAIFGPSNQAAWSPWTPNSRSGIVRSEAECSPCSYVGHGIGLREGCAARTCMRMVSAAMVVEAAINILNNDNVGAIRESPLQKHPNRIHILGLPVDGITYAEWLDVIGQWIKSGEGCHHVCTTNPEFMMIARKDPNFRNILQRADLCVPDGVGLMWAAKHKGTPLPERVTGSDGVPKIAERAAKTGWKLFFLGAWPGVADQAADILRERYPGVQIVGTYSGSPKPEEEDALVEMVNASGADILLVAYGAPVQDKWIARNLPRLQVSMAMGVGGAFDYIAGKVPRAPVWMRQMGLEWLFRLIRQPRRIGRMTRLPRFVLAVLRER